MAKNDVNWFDVLLRVLGVISLVPCALFIYFMWIITPPTTDGFNYLDPISLTAENENNKLEDSELFLTVNLYKNIDEKKSFLFEVKVNSYLDFEKTGVKSYGVQIFDNYKTTTTLRWDLCNLGFFWEHDYYQYSIENRYDYYISNENVCTASPNIVNANSEFFITSGGEQCKLTFKEKSRSDFNYKTSWLWTTEYYVLDENFFINYLYNQVKSLDEGTYYMTEDMGLFCDFYLYNKDSKQFDISITDTTFIYCPIKIMVYDEGVSVTTQSLFDMIAANDGSVELSNDDIDNPFWKIENNYSINESSFDVVYDEEYKIYLLNLREFDREYLSKFQNVALSVEIDISKFDKVVNGFMRNAFNGLEVKEVILKDGSLVKKDFYCFSDSLSNNSKLYYQSNLSVHIQDNLNITLEVLI